MLPLTTFYRSGAHRSDVYKWDAFVTSWRFYSCAWQPHRHDRLPETSGTLWIHRGALTNQRCSLATGCGIKHYRHICKGSMSWWIVTCSRNKFMSIWWHHEICLFALWRDLKKSHGTLKITVCKATWGLCQYHIRILRSCQISNPWDCVLKWWYHFDIVRHFVSSIVNVPANSKTIWAFYHPLMIYKGFWRCYNKSYGMVKWPPEVCTHWSYILKHPHESIPIVYQSGEVVRGYINVLMIHHPRPDDE